MAVQDLQLVVVERWPVILRQLVALVSSVRMSRMESEVLPLQMLEDRNCRKMQSANSLLRWPPFAGRLRVLSDPRWSELAMIHRIPGKSIIVALVLQRGEALEMVWQMGEAPRGL